MRSFSSPYLFYSLEFITNSLPSLSPLDTSLLFIFNKLMLRLLTLPKVFFILKGEVTMNSLEPNLVLVSYSFIFSTSTLFINPILYQLFHLPILVFHILLLLFTVPTSITLMSLFKITVTRISWSTQSFLVHSDTQPSAIELALKEAYNTVWSSHASEYEIENIDLIE